MNRVRRSPFGLLMNEVNTMQQEFNRLFNTPGAPAAAPLALLPLNVWEDDQVVYVEADLPGVDPAKLDITVTEGNRLSVQGERAAPDAKAAWARQERPVGQFAREVELPALVDPDKVDARYEAGVLRLTLPKHEAVKPRKIQVNPGA